MSEDTRIPRVGLDEIDELLESLDYPASRETLVDRFGSRELELIDDTVTLGTVFSRDPEGRTYRSPEAVRRAATRLVGRAAVRPERADPVTVPSDRADGSATD